MGKFMHLLGNITRWLAEGDEKLAAHHLKRIYKYSEEGALLTEEEKFLFYRIKYALDYHCKLSLAPWGPPYSAPEYPWEHPGTPRHRSSCGYTDYESLILARQESDYD